jgi:hypothetical protein
MKHAMKKYPVPINRCVQVPAGLAVMVGGAVQAQKRVALSGPAFALADQGLAKSYAGRTTEAAEAALRAGVCLRPDVASPSAVAACRGSAGFHRPAWWVERWGNQVSQVERCGRGAPAAPLSLALAADAGYKV